MLQRTGDYKIYALLFFTMLLVSCGGWWLIDGTLGISSSIDESKRYEVYIAEYSPLENPYYINDTILIEFDEIWSEYIWYHTEKYGEINIYKDRFPRLVFKKQKKWYDFSIMDNYYGFYFKENGDSFYVYDQFITVSLDTIQFKKDTLELRIKDLSFFVGDTSVASTLGKIIIVKKK